MQHSPSWETTKFSASQEIPCNLWNPKVHYRNHKSLLPVPVQKHINQSSPNDISWWSILTISSPLRLGLPCGLLPSVPPTKILHATVLSQNVLRAPPILFLEACRWLIPCWRFKENYRFHLQSHESNHGVTDLRMKAVFFFKLSGTYYPSTRHKYSHHRVKRNQLDAQLILSIFRQPLHVSGLSTAHHQEVQQYVYNIWYLLFCLLSWLQSN